MEDWSAKELASRVPAERPLLYPFAGPDALHAIALFGHVKRVFMIGLEGLGALPDPWLHLARTWELAGAIEAERGFLHVAAGSIPIGSAGARR